MALVVEDGTGKADSNSYSSVADADTYYGEQGYSDAATEGDLIRGSRALDMRYATRLQGIKSSSGQAMLWPRDGVSDEDGNFIAADSIPSRWVMAAQEMARTVTVDQSDDAESTVKSVKAGSVGVDFSAPMQQRTILSYVDELVEPYLSGSGSSFVRA